jgi:branched-chain amino acid transport system ATP-binding protein
LYGDVEVVHGIDIAVNAGEVVVLLGSNGAGKTTTLLSLVGAVKRTGTVEILGDTRRQRLDSLAKRGVAFLPEERGVIRSLTVAENLRLADVIEQDAYGVSPELEALRNRRAGLLSGGEQQILALTRAVAKRPRVLLADELSFGLAPLVVSRMLALSRAAADAGAAVLLVEQYAHRAMAHSERAYVLSRGRVVLEGPCESLRRDLGAIERAYLGGGPGSEPGPAAKPGSVPGPPGKESGVPAGHDSA